jgi:hypothetical protein
MLIYLASQAIDVDVHHVRRGINSHAPNVVQNHRASNHSAGISTKIFQEGKLLWSQLQHMAAAAGFMTYQVELQVSSL